MHELRAMWRNTRMVVLCAISAALYAARKAEEFDPNNYDIKNLIRKLETSHHEGLVPDDGRQ